MHNTWLTFILLLAPLVIVPLAIQNASEQELGRAQSHWRLPAAGLLLIAYLLDPGLGTGWLAVPWLIFAFSLFGSVFRIWQRQGKPISHFWVLRLAALLYLSIGAMWALADRFHWQPMGFDPLIVLLTAVHFHYAGFALLWLAGKALKQCRQNWEKHLISIVVLGVPLTAVGITTSHWQWSPIIEVGAVISMATGGIAVGMLYLRTAFAGNHHLLTRFLWVLAGLSLLVGMSLAILYGIRYYRPIPWLSIPWMYFTHGLLNSLGFALCGLLGFWWENRYQSARLP